MKEKVQVFGRFFKRHGNAEYRSIYCVGADYGIVY